MNILIVEENSANLKLFKNEFTDLGYDVLTAENGKKAWEIVRTRPVDIIVSDWIMPEMDGLGLCRLIRSEQIEEYIYFILVTSQDSHEDIIKGLEAGSDDYVTKPLNINELKARVEIGARIVDLERQSLRRYDEIKRNSYQTISMFTSLIETFDEDLGGHCRRTGKLCVDLARMHPNVSKKEYKIIESAGLLHDIGMIGLPNEILTKKRTERNDDERKHYFSHPERGGIILNEIDFLRPIAKIVKVHHEQINGRGFPNGLKGDEISVLGKILSAASIYDNFVYRGKVLLEDIPKNLTLMKGHQLDPYIVDLLFTINMNNINEEKGRDFNLIGIDELEVGMVLAKEIRMKTGALAMPVDMELSSYGIEKLNSYKSLDCVKDIIYVYKK